MQYTADLHEDLLVRNFIKKHRRNRAATLLKNANRRRKFLQRLGHFDDFIDDVKEAVPPGKQTTDGIIEMLMASGAPERCYVISENEELDGKVLPLREVIDEVLARGYGTIISCVPGVLGFYESEELTIRYVLRRLPNK